MRIVLWFRKCGLQLGFPRRVLRECEIYTFGLASSVCLLYWVGRQSRQAGRFLSCHVIVAIVGLYNKFAVRASFFR